ncbi:MAG: hypothetical protein ACPK85_11520 [Methanosarcina sp.]
MQILREKPRIDPVFKVHTFEIRQEIEQKDAFIDKLKIHSRLKEFEPTHFETQTPEMTLSISSNSSPLAGSMHNNGKTGLYVLHMVEKNSSVKKLELTEKASQVTPGRVTEVRTSRPASRSGN